MEFKESRLLISGGYSLQGILHQGKDVTSGVEKLTWSGLKGVSNRALSAYKNGRFASSFLLLGIGF